MSDDFLLDDDDDDILLDEPTPEKAPATNTTERIIYQHEYGLDNEAQEYIEKNWKDKSQTPLQMARKIFQKQKLDESSEEFQTIKKYLAKLYRKSVLVELTEKQRNFIQANGRQMKPYEMAKTFFLDKKVSPLGAEVKTIERFAKAVGAVYQSGDEPESDRGYKPPNTDLQVIKKINECDTNASFDKDSLTSGKKKCVESCKKYLAAPRFVVTINTFKANSSKDLFESSFIQSTYDKPDLNSEEINMYINLCSDYVLIASLQKQMANLNELIDEVIADDDDGKKLAMSLADAYSSKVQEYHQCQQRMQKLQESLSDKRSNRLKDEATANESITKLVENMQEDAERKKMARITAARNLDLDKEIDRLESAPEYIARIMGVGRDELLNN